ncbi:MAG: class I SAM-dependent methyltransferase [Magnetococcus sp. WYHC-3]
MNTRSSPVPCPVALWAETPAQALRAHDLAARLGLPLVEGEDEAPHCTAILRVSEQGLSLDFAAGGTLAVDFRHGALATRLAQAGRRQPLARAVGLHRAATPPQVLDATAGLGRDGFWLASLGCSVTLVERVPVLALLLEDALERAARDGLSAITHRMRLVTGEARSLLEDAATPTPEVVYLDPMYPDLGKSALVKQELRLVRAMAGDDPDAAQTLEVALARASRQVVVKRHRHAPPLGNRPPHWTIEARTIRFDVYRGGS